MTLLYSSKGVPRTLNDNFLIRFTAAITSMSIMLQYLFSNDKILKGFWNTQLLLSYCIIMMIA